MGWVSRWRGGLGGDSLVDCFPNDGDEGILEGGGEGLGEEAGDGVVHGGLGGVLWVMSLMTHTV